MSHYHLFAYVFLSTMCFAVSAYSAETCKAKVDKKTGLISVSAKDVNAGTLLWGHASGAETNLFFDPGCVSGTTAKNCVLADPTSLAARTPPDACTIYVTDSNGSCSAWIPGCTPGIRTSGSSGIPCDWSGTRWLSSGIDGGCGIPSGGSGARVTCSGGVVTNFVYLAGCGTVE
jgi:hypothetical protein